MKKKMVLIVLALGLLGVLAACGQDEQPQSAPASSSAESSVSEESVEK